MNDSQRSVIHHGFYEVFTTVTNIDQSMKFYDKLGFQVGRSVSCRRQHERRCALPQRNAGLRLGKVGQQNDLTLWLVVRFLGCRPELLRNIFVDLRPSFTPSWRFGREKKHRPVPSGT
jgi:hypothetical protein